MKKSLLSLRKLVALGVLLPVMAMTMVGCGGSKPAPETAGLEKVVVILDYVPNTNHTGMYVALDKGYYKAMGLDVEIIEPTEGATPALVAAGKGDFGVSYQEDVTYSLAAKDPLPIKAIAAIIQHNTSGFGSYAPKGIKGPKDFEGKVYSGWGAPSEEAVIKGVMEAAGADFSKLNIVTSDGAGFSALEGDVDIIWMYRAWDYIFAKRAGMEINYEDLGKLDPRLDYYTPVIIANNKVLEEKPEMVKKFMEATAMGYMFAIDSPKEAAEVIHKYADIYELDMLIESQEYLADKYMEDSSAWGLMEDKVWDRYTEFMLEYGLIDKKVKAEDCYTNEFLPTGN